MATAQQTPALRRRPRRRQSPLLTLLILLLVVLAVVLVVALLMMETAEPPAPMLGPGVFADAKNFYRFSVPEGWEAKYNEEATRVERVDGTLPDYDLDIRLDEQLDLVVSLTCSTLYDRSANIARLTSPWDARLATVDVPCRKSQTTPIYTRLYLTLNDGSGNALIVVGPVDGRNWIVARSEPFEGTASSELIAAMSETVTSARRTQK